MEFKDKLKELRTKNGKTQKQIADDLKISATCYAGYEQGYREPDLAMLSKICKTLNVTSDYLLGLSDY